TFTADNSFAGTGSVQVVSFTDTAGNAGTGDTDTVAIDTANPTVDVDILDLSLSDTDNSSQVTFTFSESAVPGSVTLAVAHGSLSPLVWNAGNTSATATFTADNSFAGTGSVQVVSFTDTAGNAGTGDTDTVAIDTANPTVDVDILDLSLSDTDNSSQVTFTFSESAVPGSVTLAVAHGSLSPLVWNAGNTSATATFTADNSFAGTGSVQVVSFTDTAGNAGTGDTDTVAIDTANPTVDVDILDLSLSDTDNSSQVTFTFSEAAVPGSVTLAVAHGSLSPLVWNAGNTSATATFTADNSFAGTGSVEGVSTR